MKPNQIKVDRLEIRLKGADAKSARELGGSIGAEVLEQIARQVNVQGRRRFVRIAHLDAGKLQLGTGAMRTADAIAKQVGVAVRNKLGSGAKGPR